MEEDAYWRKIINSKHGIQNNWYKVYFLTFWSRQAPGGTFAKWGKTSRSIYTLK